MREPSAIDDQRIEMDGHCVVGRHDIANAVNPKPLHGIRQRDAALIDNGIDVSAQLH
jgi:hypothetical protein